MLKYLFHISHKSLFDLKIQRFISHFAIRQCFYLPQKCETGTKSKKVQSTLYFEIFLYSFQKHLIKVTSGMSYH